MPLMSEKLKLIVLDPKSRIKLEELGRIEGSPVISPEDLSSSKSKKLIATLPILKDTTCGLENPSAGNLELLRQFSKLAKPNITLWASTRMDDVGQIRSIDHSINIELAQALLKTPNRLITEIAKDIGSHSSKLPREWLDPELKGGKIAVHFSEIGVDLSEIEDPDMAAEVVGPKLSHFLFDVVLVLKMMATAQKGKGTERQTARQFLGDMLKISMPYLKGMSKHTQKTNGTFQISIATHHALYAFFILTEQANKILGGHPLVFSIPPPTAL